MNIAWIIAIVVGGIIGWISSAVMKTHESRDTWADIVIGLVGGGLGQWFFVSVLGIGITASLAGFSLLAIVWGIIGSIITIGVMRAIWPSSTVPSEEHPERGYAHEFRERRRGRRSGEDEDENL